MIIAEVGLNHLGDTGYADKYVQQLAASDVDGVTFQIREPEFYNNELNSRLLLPSDWYLEASQTLKSAGKQIGFGICSPDAIETACTVNADFVKVLSWAIFEDDFMRQCYDRFPGHVFASTGTSDMADIINYCKKWPSFVGRTTFIHTTLSNDIDAVELSAIRDLRDQLDVRNIAYGHHCETPEVLYLALAFEPSDIFIYVIGAQNSVHPDQDHAIPTAQLVHLCARLRELPSAIGTGEKLRRKNEIAEKWHLQENDN
ncbi:N-acetylneuraminate synthase family protein [Rhodospirillales bacterium]|nr:N-acetylneuraminate synthase family protein [Rhodospirillales bacterium]